MRNHNTHWRKTPAAVIVLLIALASTSLGAHPTALAPLRTQLYVVGDDGLTQRFADALDAALVSSPKFLLAPSGAQHDLRLLLAGNLYGHKSGREFVFYIVVVVTDSEEHFLGVHTSLCWESEMKVCAEKAVADAYRYSKAAPNISFEADGSAAQLQR